MILYYCNYAENCPAQATWEVEVPLGDEDAEWVLSCAFHAEEAESNYNTRLIEDRPASVVKAPF